MTRAGSSGAGAGRRPRSARKRVVYTSLI